MKKIRIFRNKKTGKIREYDENEFPNIVEDLEKNPEWKELIEI